VFSESPIPVDVVIAQAPTAGPTAVLDATGYVIARRQATVSSKISGKLAEVLIEEGVEVEADQLLARLDDRPPADWDRDAMSLEPPFRPIWRVGGIAVGLDTDSVRLLIELTEFVPEGDTEPRSARISMDRDQARRFAAHAVSIVGEGRARCRLCSRPIEVDGGHVCPGTNGHGPLTS
jgi:uncharacterized repeat protein (TIGR03847 family)